MTLVAFLLFAGTAAAQVQVHPDSLRLPPPPPVPPARGAALMVDFERHAGRLTSVKAVESFVDSAAACGFRRLIVGLKRRDGRVVFPSRRAPRIELSFDYWGAFQKASARRGLELVAHLSVLAEGDPRTRTGPAYDRPEWQTWARPGTDTTRVRQADHPAAGPVILANPAIPEVQQYEGAVVSDLIQNLKPKFLILDDVRFFHADADLGDSTRVRFDRWIGLSPTVWPDQVVAMDSPRYGLWRTFRVGIVREFLGRLRTLCRTHDPELKVGLAVPSIYEAAINSGVNWADPEFRPAVFYAKDDFRSKALAPLFDEYLVLNRDANPRALLEIINAVHLVSRNALPASITLQPEQFMAKPGRFREALQTIAAGGHSVVIADSSRLPGLGLWEILKEELAAAPTVPPGGAPGGR